MNSQPRNLIAISLILLVFGAVFPFLTVIGIVDSTFFFNFVAYFASVVGLFLGFLGIAMYVGKNRKDDDWGDY